MTNFRLVRSKVALPGAFTGYGAQYNQNIHVPAFPGNERITDQDVVVLKQRLKVLKPQLVRIFFSGDAFKAPKQMESFKQTVALAQATAETINITFQGIGEKAHRHAMPQFAKLLHELVTAGKISKLKWVTVRNEPNRPAMKMEVYRELYQELDAELKSHGVRSQIGFMGGDLLEQAKDPVNNQGEWFKFLATEMSDLLGAYSIHVYWDYFAPQKLVRRLTDVREIWDGLAPAARKPLYVTEYGVRGKTPASPGAKLNPGLHENLTPLGRTKISAFQEAWFALLAAKLGFHGAVKWDAYFGKYGKGGPAQSMAFELIGPPPEWQPAPAFHLLRLLTMSASPGSKVFEVATTDETPSSALVVGFAGPASGQLAVVGLDTAGGKLTEDVLNTKATAQSTNTYHLEGLPPDASFQLRYWNRFGGGQLTRPAPVRNEAGVVTVAAPVNSVFAITSTGTQ